MSEPLDADTLWREAIAFGRASGHCQRSQAWHDKEPCITCQEFVNFARHILELQQKAPPGDPPMIPSTPAAKKTTTTIMQSWSSPALAPSPLETRSN